MERYIITYDLKAPGRNYDELYSRIKSYSYWGKITESSWAIKTNQSHTTVRNYLKGALDANDSLLVGKFGYCAWVGLSKEVSDWLKN